MWKINISHADGAQVDCVPFPCEISARCVRAGEYGANRPFGPSVPRSVTTFKEDVMTKLLKNLIYAGVGVALAILIALLVFAILNHSAASKGATKADINTAAKAIDQKLQKVDDGVFENKRIIDGVYTSAKLAEQNTGRIAVEMNKLTKVTKEGFEAALTPEALESAFKSSEERIKKMMCKGCGGKGKKKSAAPCAAGSSASAAASVVNPAPPAPAPAVVAPAPQKDYEPILRSIESNVIQIKASVARLEARPVQAAAAPAPASPKHPALVIVTRRTPK